MPTYADGLKDAANLLIKTAEDYESSFLRRTDEIQRAIKNKQLGVDGLKNLLKVDREKASLLRGQAVRIGELLEPQNGHLPAQPSMRP